MMYLFQRSDSMTKFFFALVLVHQNFGFLTQDACDDDSCPEMAAVSLLQESSILKMQADPASSPAFGAKTSSPAQFLIISSPSREKVVWTTLENMQSAEHRVQVLIEHGLKSPKGMAFDRERGFLYIADSGAQKIFRYTVVVDLTQSKPSLTTTHVRMIVVQNCGPVEWVTVDEAGNLFYSAPLTNNINKVPREVMKKVASGELKPSALTVIPIKSVQAAQVSGKPLALNSTASPLPTDPPPVKSQIYSIYEAALNANVAHPAAIVASGPDLYWTNQADGSTAGALVKGQVDPKLIAEPSKQGLTAFPSTALTKAVSGAIGLAIADKTIFFSRSDSSSGSGSVSALLLGSSIMVDIASNLAEPRGLAWDRDQTMYVADEAHDQVLSFPTGRLMTNAPLSEAASMVGPYGLVVVSSRDRFFTDNRAQADGGMKPAQDDDSDQATNPAESSTSLF